MNIFVYLLFIVLPYNAVECYKFLAVTHTIAKSHFYVGSSLMKALAQKGHEVHIISPFPQSEIIENYHDIPIHSVFDVMQDYMDNLFYSTSKSDLKNVWEIYDIQIAVTEAVLQEKVVRELMASNQTFDAVIFDTYLGDALYGLSELFKAPLIGFSPTVTLPSNNIMVGSPAPPSYVPFLSTKFTDHMTLSERVANLASLTISKLIANLYYMPRQVALYKKYFPNLTRDLHEIRKNTALVLVNTHVSYEYPRPYMPNMIEVGGMHINREEKALPPAIAKFINESEYGVIYFSLGTNVRSKELSGDKLRELFTAFRSIKQRVLWKFDPADMVDKQPDNVFISPWFDQADILAHDNVKVFMTHGGMLSITESIYHRTPIIGIPLFMDQFYNVKKAVKNGYGIELEYKNLNVKNLLQALERILNDNSFQERINEVSDRHRDQEMLPMDKAVYWVEHVARHKGATYMHCAGLDLNFIEYHNLDVIAIFVGVILLVIFAIYYLVYIIIKTVGQILDVLTKNKKIKQH